MMIKKKIINGLAVFMAVMSVLGTTVYAGSVGWNKTVYRSGDYVTSNTAATKDNSNNYAKVTCSVDNTYQLLFYSQCTANDSYKTNVVQIAYSSNSARATYSAYASDLNYYAYFKLGPSSRYASLALTGTFQP